MAMGPNEPDILSNTMNKTFGVVARHGSHLSYKNDYMVLLHISSWYFDIFCSKLIASGRTGSKAMNFKNQNRIITWRLRQEHHLLFRDISNLFWTQKEPIHLTESSSSYIIGSKSSPRFMKTSFNIKDQINRIDDWYLRTKVCILTVLLSHISPFPIIWRLIFCSLTVTLRAGMALQCQKPLKCLFRVLANLETQKRPPPKIFRRNFWWRPELPEPTGSVLFPLK